MSAPHRNESTISTEGRYDAKNAEQRLRTLEERYGRSDVCLAAILCDGHAEGDSALRLIDADLTITDVTYGELRERSERCAAALAELGVGPGDRVATLMGKSADLVTVLLGIWRRGAVHVPLFTAFAAPAIEFRLRSSAAKLIVADADQTAKLDTGDASCRVVVAGGEPCPGALSLTGLLEAQRPAVAAEVLAGEGPFIMIFTSGTTGAPKGVPMSARSIAAWRVYLEYGLGVTGDDVHWNVADPGWAYGLCIGIVAALAAGHCVTMLTAPFDPALAWQVLDRVGVTNLAAAPTVYRALRAVQRPASVDLPLRCLSSAGEPLDAETLRWAQRVLGVDIRDHYGQTELGMVVANAWHPEIRRAIKPGSMGTTLPGWTVEILCEDSLAIAATGELGRVAIDIPKCAAMPFMGYHNAPETTAARLTADGRWYLTGDTASRDEDGYFWFLSRDDDVIIMAGYRIGPFEVESVLIEHSAVAEAAVVGVPDELRGEVVEAFVALRPGIQASDELADELKEHVKTGFAAHAYPRAVHFVDALPRTPSGKVQRFVLRNRRRDELAAL